jgi:hypothetical protein
MELETRLAPGLVLFGFLFWWEKQDPNQTRGRRVTRTQGQDDRSLTKIASS